MSAFGTISDAVRPSEAYESDVSFQPCEPFALTLLPSGSSFMRDMDPMTLDNKSLKLDREIYTNLMWWLKDSSFDQACRKNEDIPYVDARSEIIFDPIIRRGRFFGGYWEVGVTFPSMMSATPYHAYDVFNYMYVKFHIEK